MGRGKQTRNFVRLIFQANIYISLRTSMLYTQPSRNAFVQLFYQSLHVNKTRSTKHEFQRQVYIYACSEREEGKKKYQKNNNKWKLQNWIGNIDENIYRGRRLACVSYFDKLEITNRTRFVNDLPLWTCISCNKNVNFPPHGLESFSGQKYENSFFSLLFLFLLFFFSLYIWIIY